MDQPTIAHPRALIRHAPRPVSGSTSKKRASAGGLLPVLCLTLCLGACGGTPLEPVLEAGILIDASRDGGVWWFPQADSFSVSRPHQGQALADDLRSRGYEVEELGRGVEVTDALLSQYDKVIRAGMLGTYTASELSAYDRYVSRADAKLVLIPHFLRPGQIDLVAQSIGLPMEGMHSGVMSPVGATGIVNGVGPLSFGPGSAVGPNPGAAITPLGTLQDGRVVMGLVTSHPAEIMFLGDLRLLELVPEPLVSNVLTWLES